MCVRASTHATRRTQGDTGGGRESWRRKGRRRKGGIGEENDKIDEKLERLGGRMTLLYFNKTEGGDGEG